MNASADTIAVHQHPVWRHKANFLIHAEIHGEVVLGNWSLEQLWCRQLTADRFEICCIPFFLYDLALGDEVVTDMSGAQRYLLQRVVKPAGHSTFRVWFGHSYDRDIRQQVADTLLELDCPFEWFSENLLAIDAASEIRAQALADELSQREQRRQLLYEIGRS